jgi:hypothetical protein
VNSRIVDHLVAREGLPPRSGLAFDYVLGGDGLFVVAANPWLELRVPVARCTVRGLPPVYTACTLSLGRLQASIWDGILTCLQVAHSAGCEVLTGVYHDGEAYRLIVPRQVVAHVGVDGQSRLDADSCPVGAVDQDLALSIRCRREQDRLLEPVRGNVR